MNWDEIYKEVDRLCNENPNRMPKDEEGVLQMARICVLPDSMIEFYIRTDDPNQSPNFHIRKYKSDKSGFLWESCISIILPEYRLHGCYQTKLNDELKQVVDNVMGNIIIGSNSEETYWERAVEEWNSNNQVKLSKYIEKPDYTLLS